MLAMKPSRSKVIGANDNKKTSVSKNQKHSKNTTDECSAQNACGSSNETRSVYIDALKEKLKCSETESESGSETRQKDIRHESCADQAEQLVADDQPSGCIECNKWQKKYNELKKQYITLSLRHTDQLMKHDELLKNMTSNEKLVDRNTGEMSDGAESTSDEVFTPNEIRHLLSLPLDKKKDSTFILQCVQYAYKNNVAALANKTLKGTGERIEVKEDGARVLHPGKESLTPEKVRRIEQIFIDRVSRSTCMASEFGDRVKQSNINKHIASAIKNVANKGKPKNQSSTQNEHLNL